MSPWIEANRPSAASRWLDESGISLLGRPIGGSASVSGDPMRTQGPALEAVNGRTSVLATMSVDQYVTGSSAGSASVSGLTGRLYEQAVTSNGGSSVTGELMHGQVETMAGVSAGKSVVGNPSWSNGLEVERNQWVTGEQSGDGRGDGERRAPSGSDRGDGLTRPRFSPRSIGRVSNEPSWRKVR